MPLNWSELAFLGPLSIRDENPRTRIVREFMFKYINRLINFVGEHESNPVIMWIASEHVFPKPIAILVSRLLEWAERDEVSRT